MSFLFNSKLTQEENGARLSIDVHHGPQRLAEIHSCQQLVLSDVVAFDVQVASVRNPEFQH